MSKAVEEAVAAKREGESRKSASERPSGLIVGVLVGFKEGGPPLVTFPGQPGAAALLARSVVDVHAAHVGCDVALGFEQGAPERPIILGCLAPRNDALALQGRVEVQADGERFVLTAQEELILRCGRASIRLTKAGQVFINGESIVSTASGVHRIRGGSVQLN